MNDRKGSGSSGSSKGPRQGDERPDVSKVLRKHSEGRDTESGPPSTVINPRGPRVNPRLTERDSDT